MAKKSEIRITDIYEQFIKQKMEENAPIDVFLDIFKKLADMYLEQGDKDKHIGLIRRYMEYIEPIYGENSEDYLFAICMLSTAYYNFKEDKLFFETTEKIKEIAGNLGENEDIAALLSAISSVGFETTMQAFNDLIPDPAEEMEQREKKLEDARAKYGISPMFMDILEDIVDDSNNHGEYEYSIELLERTLDELDSSGPHYMLYAIRLYNAISSCYEEMGNLEYAIEYKKSALDILKDGIGKEDDLYQAAFIEYIDILNFAGKYKKALDEARKMLRYTNKMFSMQSHYSSELRISIATSLFFLKRNADALKVAEENYDINNCYYGESADPTLAARTELAVLYQGMNEYKKALTLYKALKKDMDSFYGRNSDYSIELRKRIAEVYIALNDGKNAVREASFLVKHFDKKSGLDSHDSLLSHYLLGCAYRENMELELALKELNEVYNKQVDIYSDPEDEEALVSLFAIGTVFELAGEEKRAHEVYSEVLESALRTIGPDADIAKKAADALEE